MPKTLGDDGCVYMLYIYILPKMWDVIMHSGLNRADRSMLTLSILIDAKSLACHPIKNSECDGYAAVK